MQQIMPDEQATGRGIQTDIVRETAAWDALSSAWQELFAACPTATPPLRWEWLRTWWRIYGTHYAAKGRGDDGLRLFLVRENGRLIAALPLYLRRGRLLQPSRLGFLSTGEDEAEETCAENLDMLCLPGRETECLAALMPLVLSEPADEIVLGPLTTQSPLARWQAAQTDGAGFRVEEHGPCYVADLTGGFEAYLSRLSRNSRSLVRKRLSGAEREGARIEIAHDWESVQPLIADLVALHQARWEAVGKPGCFAAPRFTEFHRACIQAGIENGDAVLARLVCGTETVAAMVGYTAHGKFDSYVAGTKTEDEPVKSAGIVLHMLLKKHLSEHGVTHYDHLGGTMRYKQQYTTEERPAISLHRTRPTLRAAAGRASELLHGMGRRGRRLVTQGIGQGETGASADTTPVHKEE